MPRYLDLKLSLSVGAFLFFGNVAQRHVSKVDIPHERNINNFNESKVNIPCESKIEIPHKSKTRLTTMKSKPNFFRSFSY